MKTRFRGPLVAQTSVGRLAQPCGAGLTPELKSPANVAVERRSSPGVVAPDSACHAGGRGFESRRSRLTLCRGLAAAASPRARPAQPGRVSRGLVVPAAPPPRAGTRDAAGTRGSVHAARRASDGRARTPSAAATAGRAAFELGRLGRIAVAVRVHNAYGLRAVSSRECLDRRRSRRARPGAARARRRRPRRSDRRAPSAGTARSVEACYRRRSWGTGRRTLSFARSKIGIWTCCSSTGRIARRSGWRPSRPQIPTTVAPSMNAGLG